MNLPTQLVEHTFKPLGGGTSLECSCGDIFGTTAAAVQHKDWQFNLAVSRLRDGGLSSLTARIDLIEKRLSQVEDSQSRNVDKDNSGVAEEIPTTSETPYYAKTRIVAPQSPQSPQPDLDEEIDLIDNILYHYDCGDACDVKPRFKKDLLKLKALFTKESK